MPDNNPAESTDNLKPELDHSWLANWFLDSVKFRVAYPAPSTNEAKNQTRNTNWGAFLQGMGSVLNIAPDMAPLSFDTKTKPKPVDAVVLPDSLGAATKNYITIAFNAKPAQPDVIAARELLLKALTADAKLSKDIADDLIDKLSFVIMPEHPRAGGDNRSGGQPVGGGR